MKKTQKLTLLEIKINNNSLRRRIFNWRCHRCPFESRYNDCYDDYCNWKNWLRIKFDEYKKKRREAKKMRKEYVDV